MAYYKGKKIISSVAYTGTADAEVLLEAVTVTPSAETQQIEASAGKTGISVVTVIGDSNLKAENIKKGVTIFGITGTCSESGTGEDTGEDVIDPTIADGTTTTYGNATYSAYNGNPYYNLVTATSTDITACEINSNTVIIGSSAISRCESLTSISIPNSVTSIENYAFYYCKALESISIPNSVTSIGNGAFDWCSSLKSIVIPDSVTTMGRSVFQQANEALVVYLEATEIPSGWDSMWNYTAWDSELIVYLGGEWQYVNGVPTPNAIEDGVQTLYDTAYYISKNGNPYYTLSKAINTEINSCEINSSCIEIAIDAFHMCQHITSIVIPKSVTTIGEGAFVYCNADIYCETESKPSGWSDSWDAMAYGTIYWGGEWQYVDGAPTPISSAFDWSTAVNEGANLNNKSLSFSGDYSDIEELYNWLLDNDYGGGDNPWIIITTSCDRIIIQGGYGAGAWVYIDSQVSDLDQDSGFIAKFDNGGTLISQSTQAMPMSGYDSDADHTIRSITFSISEDASYYGDAYASESGKAFADAWLNEHIIVS